MHGRNIRVFRQVLGMIPFLWKTMCRPAPWKRRSVAVSVALPGEPGSHCRRSYFRTRPVRTGEAPVESNGGISFVSVEGTGDSNKGADWKGWCSLRSSCRRFVAMTGMALLLQHECRLRRRNICEIKQKKNPAAACRHCSGATWAVLIASRRRVRITSSCRTESQRPRF